MNKYIDRYLNFDKKLLYNKAIFSLVLSIFSSTLIKLILQAILLFLNTNRVSAEIFGLSSFLIFISNFFRIFTESALNTTILQKSLKNSNSIKIIKRTFPAITLLFLFFYSLLIFTSPQKVFFQDNFSFIYPLILLLISIYVGYLIPIARIDLLRRKISSSKISKIDAFISIISFIVSLAILYSHLDKFLLIECYTAQQLIIGISYISFAYYYASKKSLNQELLTNDNVGIINTYIRNCFTEASIFLNGNIERYFTLYFLSPSNYGLFMLTRKLVVIALQIYCTISSRYIQPYLSFNSKSKKKNYLYLILTNIYSISVIIFAIALSYFFPNLIPYSSNLYYEEFLFISCGIFLLRSSFASIYLSIISKPNGEIAMKISIYALISSLISYVLMYQFFLKDGIYFFILLVPYFIELIIWIYYFTKYIFSKSIYFYIAIISTLINTLISVLLTLNVGLTKIL